MSMNLFRSARLVAAAAALAAAALNSGGCTKPAQAMAPPPGQVTVSKPAYRDVIDWDTYTGFLASPEAVDVRPRVSGQIVSDKFEEGSIVNKGDVLFQIDPRPFRADLDAKRASVKQSQAQVDLTKVEADRNNLAFESNAVSKTDVDTARANYDQAEAQLAAAKAAVESSRLNVEWCDVVAPIKGRVSKKIVTSGNIVTGGTAAGTLLTTIVSVDPMYCYVNVDENSALKYRRLAAKERKTDVRQAKDKVYMRLASESTYDREGTIDFIDNTMDSTTGTQQFRGTFPNPDGFLAPGFFASMRIPASVRYKATLIPDSAVNTQQELKYVYVAEKGPKGDQMVANIRPVVPGTLFGSMRAIVSGLGPDDLVVTNGTASLFQPGSPVVPTEAPMSLAGFAETGDGSPTTRPVPTTGPAAAHPVESQGGGR